MLLPELVALDRGNAAWVALVQQAASRGGRRRSRPSATGAAAAGQSRVDADAAGTDDRGSGRDDARNEGHAMTAIASSLRAVGLLAVVGAVLDPGCALTRRPTLDVVFAGDVPDAARAEEIAQLAAAAPWATVTDGAGTVEGSGPDTATARIVVG